MQYAGHFRSGKSARYLDCFAKAQPFDREQRGVFGLIWLELRVDEASLSHDVSLLRKTLSVHKLETGGRYIETLPKQGYRFVAPVRKRSAANREARASASAFQRPASARLGGADDGNSNASASDTRALKMRDRIADVPAPRRDFFSPGIRPDRYQFLSMLGAGGMGEVYLARDTRLDRKVALEVLSEKHTDNSEWLRRFVREAKAASA